MRSAHKNPSVLFVGDSQKMMGGVSAVIKSIKGTTLWEQYSCNWLECQINAGILKKLLYLCKGIFCGIFLIPRYDIIHFHTAVGNSLKVQFPFFLYARLLRKRILVHLHVGDQLKNVANDRLFHYYCTQSNGVITLGNSLRRYIPRPDKDNIHYLYNPAPPIRPKGKPEHYFLFAAFIDSEMNKGYDILLEAFSAVHELYPNWKLIICGDGDRNKLRSCIHLHHLDNSVETPGWVNGEVKDRYFDKAFAFCLPSRKEGFPMTVLESLSIGLPVIATSVGTLPEILLDGENALLCEVGNPQDLSRQMIRLIEDNTLYNKLSSNAIQLVETHLSLGCFVAKLDAIYQSLCKV